MILAHHYVITGLVQGVAYRVSTRKKAKSLGLTGWVKNLSNGDVEAVAQGKPEILSEFEQWLKIGPTHAQVLKIEKKIIECNLYTKFQIVR